MSNTAKQEKAQYTVDSTPYGSRLSFAAAEAYKLLRANLNFTLPDEKGCNIIGITSSLQGEGKSTTALNLAYAMAEDNKRVLLMELDLRLPTLAKRLGTAPAPGLSNFLGGMCRIQDILQDSSLHPKLHVVTSGDIPPNPSELLGSKEMKLTLEALRGHYDIIILDLPPINAVSDALVISRLTHGMVMVVRQNYNNKRELQEAMRQLKIVDAKVLGFVLTAAEEREEKYRSRRYQYAYSRSGRYGKKE